MKINVVQSKILKHIETLKEEERFTSPQLKKILGLNKDQVSSGCMQLWEKGELCREKIKGRSGNCYQYFKPSANHVQAFNRAMKALSMCDSREGRGL